MNDWDVYDLLQAIWGTEYVTNIQNKKRSPFNIYQTALGTDCDQDKMPIHIKAIGTEWNAMSRIDKEVFVIDFVEHLEDLISKTRKSVQALKEVGVDRSCLSCPSSGRKKILKHINENTWP
jgi:hypothetical protein